MAYHITILGEEIVDKLKIKADGIYIDCTIGFGGHSELIAEKINSVDCDIIYTVRNPLSAISSTGLHLVI